MPNRYDHETRAKAVRLVKDHVEDYETEWAAMTCGLDPAGDEYRDSSQMGTAVRSRLQ